MDTAKLLSDLEERREKYRGKEKDNASLPAGSDMYYYCRGCCVEVARLPEDWYGQPPPKHCKECKELIDHDIQPKDFRWR